MSSMRVLNFISQHSSQNNSRWLALILVLCLSLTSCSYRNIQSASLSQEWLFPWGTYKHRVKIDALVTLEQKPKTFSFDGVVQINSEYIKVVVLSPFGSTLFKLEENRETGKIAFENYIESFKGMESKIDDYYSVLKLLITAPKNLKESESLRLVHRWENGLPREIQTEGVIPKATIALNKYDKNGIPEYIKIQHPNFSIDIKVTGYDI